MAFAIPHPQLGEEIGVAVVARPGTTPDATSIRRFLHGRIAPFKVPHKVVVVDQLPTSGTGKYQRVGFAENHADLLDRSSGRAQLEATDDSTLARLAIIWVELLELDMLPEPGDHFFDLGGTSLLTMELVARIEADLGVDLPVVDVIDVATLGEMANRVEQSMGGDQRTPLLRRYRTGTTGQRLVLIPGQYGMALGLNLIADAIDADVDVYLFDYPGNRPGEQPLRSIEALAARLVEELRREGITERLSMYGNSMGGWVAYEAARTLTDAGEPPDLVGIGDMYSPFFNTKDSPLRPSIGRRVRNRLRRLRSNVSKAASRKHDTAPAAAGRQSAVFTASEIARRNYTPKPYGGDLLIVVASEREPQFGATLGWERHATGNIDTVKVDAGHSTMHVTQASVIAEGLSEHLRRRG
jgi:thioesterase domain-containing protein/acyl carrier protein